MSKGNALFLKAKKMALEVIEKNQIDPWGLKNHLPEVEKWARFLLEKYPKADKEVVLLSSWLHDIGHYPITKKDHAIKSEEIVYKFLKKENFDSNKISNVLHCVRAHRCKDVWPKTLEAKIIACADSASHMTDVNMYPSMLNEGKAKMALEKLKRDYRDIKKFKEVEDKLRKLYKAWESLINNFINFKI